MGDRMSEEQSSIIENEVNTGIVIAGAYADKIRRTLFAQLKDYVKGSKEMAKEVARAAGEVNRLLYYILVENLQSSKGDAVRVRVRYRFDPLKQRITWDYDSLRVEFYRRVNDEEVQSIVERVKKEKLEEVLKQYTYKPVEETRVEAIVEETRELKPVVEPTQPIGKPESIISIINTVDPIGETADGGVIFRVADSKGDNIGIISLEYRGGDLFIDAILIHGGEAYRVQNKASKSKEEYMDNPALLVKDLEEARIINIPASEAKRIIEEKMGEII